MTKRIMRSTSSRSREARKKSTKPEGANAGPASLMECIERRCTPAVIKAQLARGARIEGRNRLGQTGLMIAAASGKITLVRTLLDAGAQVNFVNKSGETALTYAITWNQPKIAALLIEAGADVGLPPPPRWPPLMYAAFEGHKRLLELLLRYGADPSRRARFGPTAPKISPPSAPLSLSRTP